MKDKIGILFSGLCVFHCLLSTVLILGGVGAAFLKVSEELVHPILLIFIVMIGLISFPSSYRLHHNPRPMTYGAIGTVGIFLALFFDTTLEVFLTIIFGSLLIYSHYWNNKLKTN
jgi:multisubunit Na+/H+ antiporter MnhG subunit